MRTLYFYPLVSIFLFFSSLNLSGQRLDVYRTFTHGVALVWIQNACLKCAAPSSLQNTGCKKSPPAHHRTTSSGSIFTTKACINSQKKNLWNSNTSSTCPHNMVNFGPLIAEIGSGVWGTPANFSWFRILAALLHGLVVGVSQTLCIWTEDTTYIRQGGHHVGQWPTF